MYKNVLLKLSGEALAGDAKTGINMDVVDSVVSMIKKIADMGVKVSIVVGGGNFWRGRSSEKINRETADYIGMLATTMNALVLTDILNNNGIPSESFNALNMDTVIKPYTYREAKKALNENKVVVFAGGTGHPYFSTDTAAALRATQMGSEVILCGKTIDAVYSDDPKTNPQAIRYTDITYDEVLRKDLKVMDASSIAICRDNNIKILVFGMDNLENFIKVINGENIGTIIH